MKIKFGTDGWRAIIAQDYTLDNVARVTVAASQSIGSYWSRLSFCRAFIC